MKIILEGGPRDGEELDISPEIYNSRLVKVLDKPPAVFWISDSKPEVAESTFPFNILVYRRVPNSNRWVFCG